MCIKTHVRAYINVVEMYMDKARHMLEMRKLLNMDQALDETYKKIARKYLNEAERLLNMASNNIQLYQEDGVWKGATRDDFKIPL